MNGPMSPSTSPDPISTRRNSDAGTPADMAQFTALMPK